MKRLLKICICTVLGVSLVACGKSEGGSLHPKDFEKWSKTLPATLFGAGDYDVYSVLDDPEKAGIVMDVKGLDFTTYEEYKKANKKTIEIKNKLKEFDYDSLNKDQKITYDLLKIACEDTSVSKDDYYLKSNYFDVNNGAHASLALNLYYMDITNQDVLDAMMTVMKSTTEMFPTYVDFEKERQDNGFGLSTTYMGEVIKQVNTFNGQDHTYLVDGISARIDESAFLEAAQKEEYKTKLQTIYKDNFIPAFVQLETDLKSVTVKTEDADASLVDYKGGKAYYTSMINEYTGFDSVDDFRSFLEEEKTNISVRAEELIKEYPELQGEMQAGSEEEVRYSEYDNAADVLKYLERQVNTNKEFPKMEAFPYKMDEVPLALQEIFKAAAAYFIGPYDNNEAPEQMILNGTYTQDNFSTIAHEGFPGHMYQMKYFKQTKHNMVRDILANAGYTEGWAVYASKMMNKHTMDSARVELSSLNEDLTYIYMMEVDLMIHYDNASRQDVYDFFGELFNMADEESLKGQYEQILEDPAIFVPYYGYYFRLLSLKEEAKEEWGDKYSERKFNKSVLDLGALPYELLEKYMEEQF